MPNPSPTVTALKHVGSSCPQRNAADEQTFYQVNSSGFVSNYEGEFLALATHFCSMLVALAASVYPKKAAFEVPTSSGAAGSLNMRPRRKLQRQMCGNCRPALQIACAVFLGIKKCNSVGVEHLYLLGTESNKTVRMILSFQVLSFTSCLVLHMVSYFSLENSAASCSEACLRPYSWMDAECIQCRQLPAGGGRSLMVSSLMWRIHFIGRQAKAPEGLV